MAVDEKGKNERIINEIMGGRAEVGLEGGLYKGIYSSSLAEFDESMMTPNDCFPILGMLAPMLKGAMLPLFRGLEVMLRFETSACIYQGKAEVLRSTVSNSIPLMWVRLLAPLQRVQRRRFVRVPCKIKARAYLLEVNALDEEGHQNGSVVNETKEPSQKHWFPLVLRDISLGGVGANVTKKESEMCLLGGRYLLQMAIDGNEFLLVTNLAKVFSKGEDTSVTIGLAYEGLPTCVEKLMLNFVRQQELSLRQQKYKKV